MRWRWEGGRRRRRIEQDLSLCRTGVQKEGGTSARACALVLSREAGGGWVCRCTFTLCTMESPPPPLVECKKKKKMGRSMLAWLSEQRDQPSDVPMYEAIDLGTL
ncbi:unnamed protein product, partial [Ectocarpus fasciculatus]